MNTPHNSYVLKCPSEVYNYNHGDSLEELCGLVMPIDYCITYCKFFKGIDDNYTITCSYDETMGYAENLLMQLNE
jgi:hypothetical protein